MMHWYNDQGRDWPLQILPENKATFFSISKKIEDTTDNKT